MQCVIPLDKLIDGLLAARHILSTQVLFNQVHFPLYGRIRSLDRYHDALTFFPALFLDMSDHSTFNQLTLFHYTPTPALSYLFLALFGVAAVAHTYLGFKYNMRYLVWTAATCGYLEVIGWIGRLLGALNPDSQSLAPYLLNSLFTLFAPTFMVAANFILLQHIMTRLGACYSRMNPRLYGRVFISCDLISLNIQGNGGGLSASKNPNLAKVGIYIALAGVIFQVISLFVYAGLGGEFFYRYFKNMPFEKKPEEAYYRAAFTTRVRWLSMCEGFMTVLIIIRSVYRAIELAGGPDGRVASTQWLFVVWDAVMIAAAMWSLVFLHPGWLLIESEAQTMSGLPGHSQEGDFETSSSSYMLNHFPLPFVGFMMKATKGNKPRDGNRAV
ncbi:hypothetical protein PENSPDRAFT_750575 [Peniophora sp. CONT]|nr:hypothetical protein PENSPDRAFT_750575 [Peniophora sp. CONT]